MCIWNKQRSVCKEEEIKCNNVIQKDKTDYP